MYASPFLIVGLLTLSAALLMGPNASIEAADTKGVLPERLEQLRADLKSGDVEKRRAAVKSLTHSPYTKPLLPELAATLKDDDGEVRSWAATVIGPEGEAATQHVPQLIVQLQSDPVKEARETAARALGRIGRAVTTERRSVPALTRAAAEDSDPVTRVVSLGALAMMGDDTPARIAAIGMYLHHDEPLPRMKAAHALGQLGDQARGASADIAKALTTATDPHQRGYLARACGQVGDPAALETLYAEYAKEQEATTLGEMRGAIKRLGGVIPGKK